MQATQPLEDFLRDWLPKQRWFAGKDRGAKRSGSRRERTAARRRSVPFAPVCRSRAESGGRRRFPDSSRLPTASRRRTSCSSASAPSMPPELEHAVIGHVDDMGWVYDASQDHDLMHDDARLGRRRRDPRRHRVRRRARREDRSRRLPAWCSAASSRTRSVVFGEQTIMKLFRIVVPGLNPDLEVTRALTEMGNPHVARIAGLDRERRRRHGEHARPAPGVPAHRHPTAGRWR